MPERRRCEWCGKDRRQLTDEKQIREQVAADIWEYWPFRRTARAIDTQTDVVRIECTALHTPGEWPRVAEFRVESRNDDGGTEIEHRSVQKARV